MRKLLVLTLLIVVAGCDTESKVSERDKRAIENIIKGGSSPEAADAMEFTDWDQTTYEDAGKKWTVVRFKYKAKVEGRGEFSNDILVRYDKKPTMPLAARKNIMGNGWKRYVKSLKWAQ